jgi:hypothetical protein
VAEYVHSITAYNSHCVFERNDSQIIYQLNPIQLWMAHFYSRINDRNGHTAPVAILQSAPSFV